MKQHESYTYEEIFQYQGKVLLAEDNEISQIYFHDILSRYGIAPHIVPNGEEAIKKILVQRFDLIFMDTNMPVMSGYEALKIAKMLGTEAPIIALKSNALRGDRERFLENGFDDYLEKPIIRKDFEGILFRYLSPVTIQNGAERRVL
jgi:two-component system, sensor histidine kinase